jgi:hypothetical protein
MEDDTHVNSCTIASERVLPGEKYLLMEPIKLPKNRRDDYSREAMKERIKKLSGLNGGI